MGNIGLGAQYKVRHCSQCQGDTEFYCHTCKHDLCLQCKEKHDINLDAIHHDVVICNEKLKSTHRQEICVRHSDRIYEMFCQSCELSVCFRCLEHRKHQILNIRTAYQTKRQQHLEIIDNIRSETLYNCRVFLEEIQTAIQTCPRQICHRQSQMSTKAQRLNNLIDTVVCDTTTTYKGLLIARIQQQKRKIDRLILHQQNYEDRYEQSANRAVQFLLFIKTSRVPQIKNSPNPLLRRISKIQISTRKRQVGTGCVKIKATLLFRESVCVEGVSDVKHISGVTSDRVWASDDNNIILTDITGDPIHRVTDRVLGYRGRHTVNISGELIYIDSKFNISKLSIDSKTVTTLLKRPTLPWIPWSVYYSPSTGDLMVAMYNPGICTGKITRYNNIGECVLTIQHDNTGDSLYCDPGYIKENDNGDIIVSDWLYGVVVTERGGRHRFSYTGPPSRSALLKEQRESLRFSYPDFPLRSSLRPCGICTDALSHILVCDHNTDTVQMIDKNGHFLSLLLTPQHGIYEPRSLNYDDETHLLWVGSKNTNTVSVYSYKLRGHNLTDNPEGDERITETSRSEEDQEPGTELETSDKSEYEDLKCNENSEYLTSEEFQSD